VIWVLVAVRLAEVVVVCGGLCIPSHLYTLFKSTRTKWHTRSSVRHGECAGCAYAHFPCNLGLGSSQEVGV
jgi:hypothetical protein